jgi:hypothetical protein
MQPPSSVLKSKPNNISIILAIRFIVVSCLAYCSTLKTEATCSSETFVGFQQAKIHVLYNSEDRTCHINQCETQILGMVLLLAKLCISGC